MLRHPVRARVLVVVLAAAILMCALCAAGALATPWPDKHTAWLKQWTPTLPNSFEGGQTARSATGDIYVAGQTYRNAKGVYDLTVARYTPAGTRKWVHSLALAGGNFWVNDVAADAGGNVVVAGRVAVAGNWDWLVAKWSRGGTLLWTRRIDGTAHAYDEARSVAVTATGGIVVAGMRTDTVTGQDGLLVRYSPKGVQRWKRVIDGASHSSDELRAVAVDTDGNAYAAGEDYDVARAQDALLVSYSPTGQLRWKQTWGDDAAKKNDFFSDVAVRHGYVATAGGTQNASWVTSGLVVKYSAADGTPSWSRTFASSYDPTWTLNWFLVGIDSGGRVSVAGTEPNNGSDPNQTAWVTTAYSAAGTRGEWHTWQGSASGQARPEALLTTAGGAVFVTGETAGALTTYDLFTVAFSSTGVPKWQSVVDDPAHHWDSARGVVATSSAVYVGGYYDTSLALLKYTR